MSGFSKRFARLLFYRGQQERGAARAIRFEGIDGKQRASVCAKNALMR